ncbi:beta-ketoacyl synthase N-terminal-like domain-containing protein [Klebsiella oxytoca]|uniref:beta-ketoacyl synthase N-terminal-like domain-containing protein n=1 Tax=Klebsiella oxytoca TaxID=571 RepID=UPI00292E9D7C|nr:beta-ketoacyl synthase N-terminal-like domain-containing protein [Klebsiella oxytoca]
MKVYVTAGATLLPQCFSIEDTVNENRLIPSQNDGDMFIENMISDGDFQLCNVDKTVKRISNRQSRWLLHSGIKTWNDTTIGELASPEERGLFLGLGTSDCDDNVTPVGFSEKDKNSYVATALANMQPTIGLTLLNTSSASQLAQHLDIRGDNAFFSPHSDAGASALIEGIYSIYHQKNKIALCGGVSQKISDWFYLSYEKVLRDRNCLNLTEASSFIFIHNDAERASAQLGDIRRSLIHDQTQYQQFLKQYHHLARDSFALIHTGLGCDNYDYLEPDDYVFADVPTIKLERHLGYSGAASVFLAINYAIYRHNNGKANAGSRPPNPANQVLIINHGLHGNCAAMVLNFN